MDSNMRPASDHSTLQPLVIQDGLHEFRPVTQAQVTLFRHPNKAQYYLQLIVPASVRIIHYHTSRKHIRDGFFDIEVAPIPGSSGVHGLKVCLGWDVSLQVKHPQQQAPGNFVPANGGPQAVHQNGLQKAPQAHRDTSFRAPVMRLPPGYVRMPNNQTPMPNDASRTVAPSAPQHGSRQSGLLHQKPSVTPPRPANGSIGQQGMPAGLFSTPAFPGQPHVPTLPVPLPSATQTGGHSNGNRPRSRPQQRQYSTGRFEEGTPTPVAPSARSNARPAVPTPPRTDLGHNMHQIMNTNHLQPGATSSPFGKNLQSTFSPVKQATVDLTRSPGKKLFGPSTPSKVIKSSPHRSSLRNKAEMHSKASRAFENLASEHDFAAKTNQVPGSLQGTFTSQPSLLPDIGQQVTEMPNLISPPSQTSSALKGSSSTTELATATFREDSNQPIEEMVPLGDDESLFGEGSEVGDDNERFGDGSEDDKNVNSEVEGTRSPSATTEQPKDQETPLDQLQVVEQNGQVQLGEDAFNVSASGNSPLEPIRVKVSTRISIQIRLTLTQTWTSSTQRTFHSFRDFSAQRTKIHTMAE